MSNEEIFCQIPRFRWLKSEIFSEIFAETFAEIAFFVKKKPKSEIKFRGILTPLTDPSKSAEMKSEIFKIFKWK